MKEFIIIGDTERYEGCLVYVIKGDRKLAEEVLNRMLTAPNERDLELMERHSNLRIEEAEEKDQWWNDPFLVN